MPYAGELRGVDRGELAGHPSAEVARADEEEPLDARERLGQAGRLVEVAEADWAPRLA